MSTAEDDFAELDETFLLDEDFAFWLLLDFFTALLDTGSSELTEAESSSQAVKRNADKAQIVNSFFINIFL